MYEVSLEMCLNINNIRIRFYRFCDELICSSGLIIPLYYYSDSSHQPLRMFFILQNMVDIENYNERHQIFIKIWQFCNYFS